MKSTLKILLVSGYIVMVCSFVGCNRNDVSTRLATSREAISNDIAGFGKSNKSIDAAVTRQLNLALIKANVTTLQTPDLVVAYSVNNAGSPTVNIIVHWISSEPIADSLIIDPSGQNPQFITNMLKDDQTANQQDAKMMVIFSAIVMLSKESKIGKAIIDHPQVKIALAHHKRRCSNFVKLSSSVGGYLEN